MTNAHFNMKTKNIDQLLLDQPNAAAKIKESCDRLRQGKSGLIKKFLNEIEIELT